MPNFSERGFYAKFITNSPIEPICRDERVARFQTFDPALNTDKVINELKFNSVSRNYETLFRKCRSPSLREKGRESIVNIFSLKFCHILIDQ